MTKMQPALRDYLTKLREDAYIDIKPGYIDTGASPNETKPIYTTAASQDSSKAEKEEEAGTVLAVEVSGFRTQRKRQKRSVSL